MGALEVKTNKNFRALKIRVLKFGSAGNLKNFNLEAPKLESFLNLKPHENRKKPQGI